MAKPNTYTGDTNIRGNLIAAVNGALGPGGANGGTVRVTSGATLTLGLSGELDYNTGQKVVLRGMGAMVGGSPIGALTTGLAAFTTFNGPITLASNAAIGAPSTGNNLDPRIEPHGGDLRRCQPDQGRRRGRPARKGEFVYGDDRHPGRRAQRLGQQQGLGKGGTDCEQGATLNFNNVDYITPAGQPKTQVTLMGGLGSQNDGQIRVFGGDSSFNGTIAPLAASKPIGVYDSKSIFDFSGTIKETAKSNLTKLGPGTLVLEKANTYTGDTLIRAGRWWRITDRTGRPRAAAMSPFSPVPPCRPRTGISTEK